MAERIFETTTKTTKIGDVWIATCDGVNGLGKTEWQAIERVGRKLDHRMRKLGQGKMPQVGLVESTYEWLIELIDEYFERALEK